MFLPLSLEYAKGVYRPSVPECTVKNTFGEKSSAIFFKDCVSFSLKGYDPDDTCYCSF